MGMSKAEEEEQARLERARAIGLFRYMLIREAADPALSSRQRGAMVRELAAREHAGPWGQPVRVTRWTLDVWIRRWREGGFDALVPHPRQSWPRTPPEVMELAAALKKENPARTTAQVQRILRAQSGWAPDERTIQRMFHRRGLTSLTTPAAAPVFGRFEAARPNEIWTGDALHAVRIAGRKTYLFAFLDDHPRAVMAARFGFAEDTIRLAGALRPALASRGVPRHVYANYVARNIIGQRIRRDPAGPAQHRVQARDQRRHRPVPDRDHHPEPRPRQPRAEQQRVPQHPVRPRHLRALAPVPLNPQPRLSQPGPVRPAVPGPVTGPRRSNRAPRGPLAAPEPHRHEPLMSDISPYLPLGPVRPFLDLLQELIDQLRPHRRPAQITGLRVTPHRLGIRAAQRRRRMRDTRHVIRLENFHDLPVRLLHCPSGPRAGMYSQPPTLLPEGPRKQHRHITACPSKGRSAVRQPGTIMSVYRDLGVSADTPARTSRSPGRCG
jgi:transposase